MGATLTAGLLWEALFSAMSLSAASALLSPSLQHPAEPLRAEKGRGSSSSSRAAGRGHLGMHVSSGML